MVLAVIRKTYTIYLCYGFLTAGQLGRQINRRISGQQLRDLIIAAQWSRRDQNQSAIIDQFGLGKSRAYGCWMEPFDGENDSYRFSFRLRKIAGYV
jgi:hypothetical protein